MIAKMKLLALTLVLCYSVIMLSVEGWALKEFLTKPIANQTESQIITIPKGASATQVAQILYEAKMVRHPTWLVWLMRYQNKAASLQSGEFEIMPHWTASELIEQLVSGKVVQYPFTIVAGDTLRTTLAKLNAAPKLIEQVDEATLAEALSIEQSLEGQFLPETYLYQAGDTGISILKRAHVLLQQALIERWQTRQANLPLKTPYEALILASIVEKETGYAPERALIAGVFVNRLNKKMRLQSDPTTIYGMGASYQGNIRKKDLNTKTPYNTYKINGLPPTPIAMASVEAIEAVLQPAKTKALYFVAKGQAGQHIFSNTFEAHNQAVKRYLLNQ